MNVLSGRKTYRPEKWPIYRSIENQLHRRSLPNSHRAIYTDEQRFLDGLRRDDLVSQAGRLLAKSGRSCPGAGDSMISPKADLHFHTTASDGRPDTGGVSSPGRIA